jgi:hypothetical protein
MKAETKLRLRKWALMTLRAIVWHVDEWLHRQEVRLRDELAGLSVHLSMESPRPARPQGATVSCPYPFPSDELLRHRIRGRIPLERQPQRSTEKKIRRVTAATFDLRFSSR